MQDQLLPSYPSRSCWQTVRQKLYATMVLLTVSAMLLAPHQANGQAAKPIPRHAWSLRPASFRNQQLAPGRGTLSGKSAGPVKFSSQQPQALILDGKTNDIRLATFTEQQPAKRVLPVKSITVETWIYVDRIQPWGSMVSAIQDNGSYERGWMLGIREDMFCFGMASTSKNKITYLSNPQPFLPGNWYHVAGTYDGAKMKLFVDGRLRAESAAQKGDIAYPPTGPLTLGAYRDKDEYYPLQGKMAYAAIFEQALTGPQILARFLDQKKPYPGVDPVPSVAKGWPTYGRDIRRSAYTPEQLKLPLVSQWTYQTMRPPAPAWPAPAKQDFWHQKADLPARVTYDRAFHLVSDGQRLIFASSAEDSVTCLDAATAKLRWRFTTEGPVRLAPTIDQQRVYFGSDDGFVYCLDVTDGKQLWKYQAAPTGRRIPGNERIISSWPVRSGVIIDRGQARFSAGLFPAQGTYQFAVDAITGAALARGKLSFSPQGYLQRRGTRLIVAQGRNPTPQRVGSLLPTDKPVLPDQEKILSEYPYATIFSGAVRFAGGDNRVAALDAEGTTLWSSPVRGKAYSLALANGKLFVSTDQGVIHCFITGTASTRVGEVAERPVEDPAGLFYQTTDERLAYENQAAEIIAAASRINANPLDRGYCLVLGAGRGQLAYELARKTNMQIIAVAEPGKDAGPTREALRKAGLYGRVVVHQAPLNQLGYANELFNLICVDRPSTDGSIPTPLDETQRLLRPAGGVAVISSQTPSKVTQRALRAWARPLPADAIHRFEDEQRRFVLRRTPSKDVGDWTHMYAGSANTACSQDQLVRGELQLRWYGRPGPQHMVDRHHRTSPPLVIAGRMFLPGNNRIIGVDAYNGAVLWQKPVDNFRRVGAMRDSGSMVAAADILYAVANNRCHLLDTATGKEIRQFTTPARSDKQPRHWGYIARVGNDLYGTTTRVGAARRDHSREQINETYYDFIPIVTSDSIFARHRTEGQLKWQYRPRGAIINPTITISSDRIYFIESDNKKTLESKTGRSTLQQLLSGGSRLVALDRLRGTLLWEKASGLKQIQHHLFLGYAQETLVAVGTRNHLDGTAQQLWYDIKAFSAKDGRPLWTASQNQRQTIGGSHGEQDHHPAIVQNIVYVEPFAYHLATGTRRANWKMTRGGHGCGTISASAAACFFRAGNPTMCDLATGKLSKVTEVTRPGCWINMIPAGGLLLIPEASSGCTCNFPIQTSMAFGPVTTVKPKP